VSAEAPAPSTDGEPMDVALVGIGRRGWCHLEMLRATPGVRLAALCDADPGRLGEAQRFAGPDVRAVSRVEELAAGPKPGFAVVCTLQDAQPGITRTLLESGIAALVEVPPAYDGETIRALVDAARRRGLPLGSVENYPAIPIERLKQRLIASGSLGRVTRAEVAGSAGHKGHEIAVARHYLGVDARPVRVRATRVGATSRFSGEAIDAPEGISGVVELDSGAEAAFELRAIRAADEASLGAAELRSDFAAEGGGFRDGRFHLVRDGRETPATLERTTRTVDGVEVPESLRLAELPDVVWTNPFVGTAFPPASRRPYLVRIDPTSQAWEIALADAYLDMAAAVREGRDPTVVLFHGAAGNALGWIPLLSGLGSRRVVLVDLTKPPALAKAG